MNADHAARLRDTEDLTRDFASSSLRHVFESLWSRHSYRAPLLDRLALMKKVPAEREVQWRMACSLADDLLAACPKVLADISLAIIGELLVGLRIEQNPGTSSQAAYQAWLQIHALEQQQPGGFSFDSPHGRAASLLWYLSVGLRHLYQAIEGRPPNSVHRSEKSADEHLDDAIQLMVSGHNIAGLDPFGPLDRAMAAAMADLAEAA